jgi:hypothetical protein
MVKVLLSISLTLSVLLLAVVFIADRYPQGDLTPTGNMVTGDTGAYMEYSQESSPPGNPYWVMVFQNLDELFIVVGILGLAGSLVPLSRMPSRAT